jgi:hypothetical protein
MQRKTLTCLAVLVGTLLALAGTTASADDKKDNKDKPALSGTWARKESELKIEFADKDVMKILPHGNELIVITCKYTLEKEGRVEAKVSEIEGKEEAKKKVQELVPIGLKFTFKWKVTGDAAKLDDVKGDNVETLKSHLEGDFEKK